MSPAVVLAFIFDRWDRFPPDAPVLPFVLALVGLVVLVAGFVVAAALRRRALERLGDYPQLQRMVASTSPGLAIARPILVGVALVLLFLVWGRPQSAGKARLVKERGIDLVIVLDFSKSMYARDIPRNRIDRAKEELGRLLDKLAGTRVGFVAFAGSVKELPLTTDYSAVRLFWEDLSPHDMPVGGTAIGLALTSAVRLLQRVRGEASANRDQAILLITDGEDHESEPLKAAEMARQLGIRVFTLGVGSPLGELVPEVLEDGKEAGYLKHDGKFVTTKLDETTLRQIAKQTSGKYYRATAEAFGVDEIWKEFEQLRKAETRRQLRREYRDEHEWFLFPAFLLLLVEVTLGSRRWARRRKPAADASGPGR
jgi:Ca-activated chloride channel family protein